MKIGKSLVTVALLLFVSLQAASASQSAAKDDIRTVMTEEREKERERRRVVMGENSWMEFHFLLQAQAVTRNLFDSSAGETKSDQVWTKEFIVKRARIMLSGQAADRVTFFLETDDINIGQDGPGATYAAKTSYETEADDRVNDVKDRRGVFVQDAFITYTIADELQIDIGMMLLPFMYNNRQSAVSLLGVDYNVGVIPLNSTTNIWRDTGIEIRGLLFETATKKKGLLDYRLGIWRGPADRDTKGTPERNDDINRRSSPRYCGRIQLNIMDSEPGFFYSGNYLGKKEVFSIGGGIDFQNFAVRNKSSKPEHYRAWTVDLAIDLPIGNDHALAIQAALVNVKNQPFDDGRYIGKQIGWFAQAGFLIYKTVQPVIKYMRWDDKSKKGKAEYFVGGISYFIDGHKANIKAEYQMPWNSSHKDLSDEKKATLQCQVFI